MRGDDGEEGAEDPNAEGVGSADNAAKQESQAICSDQALASSPLGQGNSSPGQSQMRNTFNSIEYSDRDVPHIIPKGTEMMPRRSICLSSEEDGAATAATAPVLNPLRTPGGGNLLTPTVLARSKSVHVTPSNAAVHSVSKHGPSSICLDDEGENDDEDDSSEREDEFFDCRENLEDTSSLAKWSSMELAPYDQESVDHVTATERSSASLEPTTTTSNAHHVSFRRVQSMREQSSFSSMDGYTEIPPHSASARLNRPVIDIADFGGGGDLHSGDVCPTTVLILVAHGGSVLDLDMEASVRKSDVTTFRGAFESIMRTHYPGLVGHVVIKCVPCPAICSEALAVLSSLSPYR